MITEAELKVNYKATQDWMLNGQIIVLRANPETYGYITNYTVDFNGDGYFAKERFDLQVLGDTRRIYGLARSDLRAIDEIERLLYF